VATRDWHQWHAQYDEAGSALAQRLDVVRDLIRIALDEAPPGELSAISMVAGQGRDLLPVLASHPRGRDVRARLVELDPGLSATARTTAAAAGLVDVDVLTGDAAEFDHYRPYVPADLVLMCGLFGNISDEDIRRTVGSAPSLTKRGGTVIWTRGRHHADMVPTISACRGRI
jgi:predicted RNA methylase